MCVGLRSGGMKLTAALSVAVFVVLVVLAGCGGSGVPANGPDPVPETDQATVGPFVIQTAASADVHIQDVANTGRASIVALSTSGVIDWLGTVEEMDRIVFRSNRDTASYDLYVADFFGEKVDRVGFLGDTPLHPEWSPDGKRIVFVADSYSATTSDDVWVIDSDGGNRTNLTTSPIDNDLWPTWSHDGQWIAFATNPGNLDIYKMLSDGTSLEQVTNDADEERNMAWSPTGNEILFDKGPFGDKDIYTVDAEGNNMTAIVTGSTDDRFAAWHPDGKRIVFQRDLTGLPEDELFTGNSDGSDLARIVGGEDDDWEPAYSSDGEWLFFVSNRDGGDYHLFAKQTVPPYRLMQITSGSQDDRQPDLGSPVPTIARVLIGDPGDDHGYDPVHPHAIAAIAAFDRDGYLNFVRLGVPPNQGATLDVTPLTNTGQDLVGVVWSAEDMYYVEQDSGVGEEPRIWDLSGRTSRSIVLYLDGDTGTLVAILDLDDDTSTVTPAAAADVVSHEVSGGSTTVRGNVRAVYGPDGQLVAEGEIGAVEIDAARGVVRAF
ncbi:MAG: hypothetical protein GF393_02595 [Armatimonadia bacterium]|nr:hypothetical protein [Armatimonadia bacterium]